MVRHSVLTFGFKVLGAVLGLANVLIVARALGPSGRGEVAFVFATTLLVAQFASLGAHWAIPNLAARDRRLLAPLLGNSAVLSLVLGLSAAAVVGNAASAIPWLGGHVAPGDRLIGLATVPVLILSYFLLTAAQSESLFRLMNLSMFTPAVTTFTANVILELLGELDVRSVVLSWAIGQVLALAVLLVGVRRGIGRFGRPDLRLARSMVGFGVKANVGHMGMAGTYRLDQWVLGSIAGARPLGLYSVAVAWAEALFFLPEAVAMVQRPELVRGGRELVSRRATAGLRTTLALTLASSAVVIAAAPLLCTVVFGKGFAGSVDDLRILALGATGVCAIKQLGAALTAQGRPLRETGAVLVALVTAIVADVLLIPTWGDLGASIASTLSYLIGGVAMAVVFAHTFRVRPAQFVPRFAELRGAWGRALALARGEATG